MAKRLWCYGASNEKTIRLRFFGDEQEVGDDTFVQAEQLSVVLQHEPGPLAFPAML